MITKNDCILLLTDIGNRGLDTSKQITELMRMSEPSIEIIKYINDNRQLDLVKFYDKVRKSYNNKRNKLYINIVKEIEDPSEVLTTLSAMLTQILLFSREVEDKQMFLEHARANEITFVLSHYFKSWDLVPCLKLLRVIKIDLKCCEMINGREDKFSDLSLNA